MVEIKCLRRRQGAAVFRQGLKRTIRCHGGPGPCPLPCFEHVRAGRYPLQRPCISIGRVVWAAFMLQSVINPSGRVTLLFGPVSIRLQPDLSLVLIRSQYRIRLVLSCAYSHSIGHGEPFNRVPRMPRLSSYLTNRLFINPIRCPYILGFTDSMPLSPLSSRCFIYKHQP